VSPTWYLVASREKGFAIWAGGFVRVAIIARSFFSERELLCNVREWRGNFFEPDMALRDGAGWLGGRIRISASGICVPLTSVLSCLAEKADRAPPAGTPAHDLLPLFASHIVT
jgi:hypothetical protein